MNMSHQYQKWVMKFKLRCLLRAAWLNLRKKEMGYQVAVRVVKAISSIMRIRADADMSNAIPIPSTFKKCIDSLTLQRISQ
jgi:hypothetical protein